MNKVWLALGSNLGDSHQILQQAWQELGEQDGICLSKLSHPYNTAPVGMESDNQFVNAVGILETDFPPGYLLQILQELETGFGRNSKSGELGYQDRLLDLDILYYGDQILSTTQLLVPHPHIAERLFVLAPLAEIDPEHLDPLTHLTAESMYHELLQKMNSRKEHFQVIEQSEWMRKSLDIS